MVIELTPHELADHVVEAAGVGNGFLILVELLALIETYPDRVRQLRDAIVDIQKEAEAAVGILDDPPERIY